MFSKSLQFFKDQTLLRRIVITLLFLILFRLGAMLTLPGVVVNQQYDTTSFFATVDLIGGGGLSSFSLFALGITPYITATIIMQLLSADIVKPISRLKKEGEKGRIKIEKITRLVAIAIAIVEGFAITISFTQSGLITLNLTGNFWTNVVLVAIMLTIGTMITIWIADKITIRGAGNGTSLIILSGIVVNIPSKIFGTYNYLIGSSYDSSTISGVSLFIIFIFAALLLIAFLAWFDASNRRIPIQQTGSGLNLDEESQTYLPIKTNPAGVIPVIFASAIITLPPLIASFFAIDSAGRYWVETNFALTSALGLSIFAVLIVGFTYFYAYINIDPGEIESQFKKGSTFIIGVKPGHDTKVYLTRVIFSMSTVGAIVLVVIAIFPYILQISGVPQPFTFGGTSSIIMISVSIDTWEQIRARYLSESKTRSQVQMTKKEERVSLAAGRGLFE